MRDFQAPLNFYSQRDAVNTFCMFQARQIYGSYCELDLYFASDVICRCKPYISRYMLDYRPPRAFLIPWTFPHTKGYWVPPLTFSRDPLSCNLDETHLTHGGGAHTKQDKGETVNKESSKEEKQLAKDLIYQVPVSHPYAECALQKKP